MPLLLRWTWTQLLVLVAETVSSTRWVVVTAAPFRRRAATCGAVCDGLLL